MSFPSKNVNSRGYPLSAGDPGLNDFLISALGDRIDIHQPKTRNTRGGRRYAAITRRFRINKIANSTLFLRPEHVNIRSSNPNKALSIYRLPARELRIIPRDKVNNMSDPRQTAAPSSKNDGQLSRDFPKSPLDWAQMRKNINSRGKEAVC